MINNYMWHFVNVVAVLSHPNKYSKCFPASKTEQIMEGQGVYGPSIVNSARKITCSGGVLAVGTQEGTKLGARNSAYPARRWQPRVAWNSQLPASGLVIDLKKHAEQARLKLWILAFVESMDSLVDECRASSRFHPPSATSSVADSATWTAATMGDVPLRIIKTALPAFLKS